MIIFRCVYIIMWLCCIFVLYGPRDKIVIRVMLAALCPYLIWPYVLAKKNNTNILLEIIYRIDGLWPKFGQLLSTRSDIVGYRVATILSKLHDKMPPINHKTMRKLMKPMHSVLSYFNQIPVAAASIAQVHRGILLNNVDVAIKILRPNVRTKMMKDIAIIRFLTIIASLLPKYKKLGLSDLVDEIQDYTEKELDLSIEAAQTVEIAAATSTISGVSFANILMEYCSTNIMISQWIKGIPLTDIALYTQYDDQKRKSEIAKSILTIFLYQICEIGLFHADPHPGNIMLSDNGVIYLVDCGIIGRLTTHDRQYLVEILHAFYNKDYYKVAIIHLDAGYVPPDTNVFDFANACRFIGNATMYTKSNNKSIGHMLKSMLTIAHRFGMKARRDFLLLQKTIITLEGVLLTLDPQINIWNDSIPWITNWMHANMSIGNKMIKSAKYLISLFEKKYGQI